MEQTLIKTDKETLSRLRVLSGGKPVAAYLRELSTDLLKDEPIPLGELTGGESVALLRTQLNKVLARLNKIDDNLDANFEALSKTLTNLRLMGGYVDLLMKKHTYDDPEFREAAGRVTDRYRQ